MSNRDQLVKLFKELGDNLCSDIDDCYTRLNGGIMTNEEFVAEIVDFFSEYAQGYSEEYLPMARELAKTEPDNIAYLQYSDELNLAIEELTQIIGDVVAETISDKLAYDLILKAISPLLEEDTEENI